MEKIILDTDIGADCDDAVALAVLLQAEKRGLCELYGISAATTRKGASSAISAICNFYGVKKDVGVLKPPALECDELDNYDVKIMNKYGENEVDRGSVSFLREKLAKSEEKIVMVAIGPLTGISRLLLSGADEYSPLSGEALFHSKVERLYCMGGCFDGSRDEEGYFNREWNFVQDLDSVRVVLDKCGVPIYFIPKETGEKVFTGNVLKNAENNPVADAIRFFGERNLNTPVLKNFNRESWDPISCYLAVHRNSILFSLRKGNVTMDKDGVTYFSVSKDGCHYVVDLAADAKTVEDEINSYLV